MPITCKLVLVCLNRLLSLSVANGRFSLYNFYLFRLKLAGHTVNFVVQGQGKVTLGHCSTFNILYQDARLKSIFSTVYSSSFRLVGIAVLYMAIGGVPLDVRAK